jgi:protein-S-isoprenylcysteine O-methyltransferase Ste14
VPLCAIGLTIEWNSCLIRGAADSHQRASPAVGSRRLAMRWLELRIPPRLAAGAVGLGMWAVSFLEPHVDWPPSHHWATALSGAAVGAAITFAGASALHAAGTTLLPMRPQRTTALVTTGIYKWSRNPMYLGLAAALVGWAAFLSAAWSLLGPVLFVLYVHRFQIQPEERVLTELFGAEYLNYTRRVRRWL